MARIMDHLDPATLNELRDRIQAELAALRDRETAMTRDETELERSVGDRQDGAATETLRRQRLVLSRHERSRMAELRAALARMEAGAYGICEESDEPIPVGRLRLEPTARYTVEAQAQLEADGRMPSDAEDDGSPY